MAWVKRLVVLYHQMPVNSSYVSNIADHGDIALCQRLLQQLTFLCLSFSATRSDEMTCIWTVFMLGTAWKPMWIGQTRAAISP